VAALPLLVTGYVVDMVAGPAKAQSWFVYAISGYSSSSSPRSSLTFLILMRHGYRWARTLLTGGGATTIVFVTVGLFAADRPRWPQWCTRSPGSGFGLIAGGLYLLHRKTSRVLHK